MTPDGPETDPFAGLREWRRDADHHAAVTARAAADVQGEASWETATLAGLLLDYQDRAQAIGLRTVGGALHQGVPVLVGTDFVVLRGARGDVAMRLVTAISVATEGLFHAASAPSDRQATDVTIAQWLERQREERVQMQVLLTGVQFSGTLRAVSQDFFTLATPSGMEHVRIDAVVEIRVS